MVWSVTFLALKHLLRVLVSVTTSLVFNVLSSSTYLEHDLPRLVSHLKDDELA